MEAIRKAVERTVRVLAVRVPAPLVGAVRARLAAVPLSGIGRGDGAAGEDVQTALCAVPHVKTVVPDPEDPRMRLVLLSEALGASSADLPESISLALRDEEDRHQVELSIGHYALRLGIEHMSVNEILQRVLPKGVDPPTSFETAGHLAHLNLRDDAVPHAPAVAAAIMAKNAHIRVVVNKTGAIEGEFRVFPMALVGRRLADGSFDLAEGEPTPEDTTVAVREGGCVFELDFAKVYWNSRLQAEHARLVSVVCASKPAVLVDMFCGVGPFSLPAAKAGAAVFANDLNPESVRWLVHNARKNKARLAHVSCADARDFVRRLFSLGCDARDQPCDAAADSTTAHGSAMPLDYGALPEETRNAQWHFVMNLPAAAHDFLDVLADVPAAVPAMARARVHCYVFCRTAPSAGQPEVEEPVAKCEAVFGRPLGQASVHRVRDVAPGKEMFCVSFVLGACDSPLAKRPRR